MAGPGSGAAGGTYRDRGLTTDERQVLENFRTEVFALEVRISGKWGSNRGKCRPRGNWPFT
jgi:hypothetical protein